MKFCLNCGAGAPENVVACVGCGRPFAHTAEVKAPEGSGVATYRPTRPDGSIPKGLGVALIAFGIVLAIWSASMSVTTYSFSSDIDPDKVATKAILTLCAEGAFALGLALWLAGDVVHAISFLPEKEDMIVKN